MILENQIKKSNINMNIKINIILVKKKIELV